MVAVLQMLAAVAMSKKHRHMAQGFLYVQLRTTTAAQNAIRISKSQGKLYATQSERLNFRC